MTAPTSQQQDVTGSLAVLLASGVAVTVLSPAVISLLTTVGISSAAAVAALTLTGAASVLVLPAGPASRATVVSEQIYRAAYLLAAAGRIQGNIDRGMTVKAAVDAEAPNFRAHLAARRNRRLVATTVDRAVTAHGLLLGWRARMDDRTSTECRAADGKNFLASNRPVIGWPGSVHPQCRCVPVAPFVNAVMVDQVATPAERLAAVA